MTLSIEAVGGVWKVKYMRAAMLATRGMPLPRCYIYTDKNIYFLYDSGIINIGSFYGCYANVGIKSTDQIPYYVIDIMFRLRILFSC
jgi:hypothetical protein